MIFNLDKWIGKILTGLRKKNPILEKNTVQIMLRTIRNHEKRIKRLENKK